MRIYLMLFQTSINILGEMFFQHYQQVENFFPREKKLSFHTLKMVITLTGQ